MKSFLFKEFLYKQILSGNKTLTRRTFGLEKVNQRPNDFSISDNSISDNAVVFCDNKNNSAITCYPKYKVGEICYLKENYTIHNPIVNNMFSKAEYIYQFDFSEQDRKQFKWKSKLMMPEKAAREFVKIKSWKVEKLQDISEYDAILEGVFQYYLHIFKEYRYKDYMNIACEYRTAKSSFISLWQSINGVQSLNINPWVFVYEFERIKYY